MSELLTDLTILFPLTPAHSNETTSADCKVVLESKFGLVNEDDCNFLKVRLYRLYSRYKYLFDKNCKGCPAKYFTRCLAKYPNFSIKISLYLPGSIVSPKWSFRCDPKNSCPVGGY